MARIEIKNRELIVHVRGADRTIAIQTTLTIPLSSVREVIVRPTFALGADGESPVPGERSVPVGAVSGTCRFPDGEGLAFCDFRDRARTVSIELEHERFRRVVLDVTNETAEDTADRIRMAQSWPPERISRAPARD